MILDGHIHIGNGEIDRSAFVSRLKEAGVDGGVVISLPPAAFRAIAGSAPVSRRLDELMSLTRATPNLYPFFWIDPMEDDALEQVEKAVKQGVAGFKVICHNYDVSAVRAMKVFLAIAAHEKPILFHSGILWDGAASSRFNRPVQFESLLEVDGLRFCLAHISWPWVDELIAVYGKFLNAYTRRPDLSVEMFIDLTPGTPPLYRRDALVKVFTVGYDVETNVIFGSDCEVNDYNTNWVREWITRDTEIYKEIGLKESTRNKVFSENLLRFLGVSSAVVQHKPLRPGQ